MAIGTYHPCQKRLFEIQTGVFIFAKKFGTKDFIGSLSY
jgi:hypothetical protein